MAHDFQLPNLSRSHSTTPKFHVLWSQQKTKPSTLPPLGQGGIHTKSKMKTLHKVPPAAHFKSTMSVKNPQELRLKEKFSPGRIQAKVRLMRTMLRNQRNLFQEICHHESFLTKLSEELIWAIQDTEDSTALNVRAMLQQQDTLVSIIDILEYSNKQRLQQLMSELQEWEDSEESQINCLALQVEQLNAKVQKAQEEVNFLSTYMDHEYPVKSVQIASLGRQVQQAKDSQQDELDNLSEMRKMVLEALTSKIWQKKKKILRSLAVKTLHPYEKALLRKVWNSQDKQRCRVIVTDFIDQLKARLPVLRAEVAELQAQTLEPRETIFKDVLLRRPKCTPDMDVILNLPEEDLLPF